MNLKRIKQSSGCLYRFTPFKFREDIEIAVGVGLDEEQPCLLAGQ